MILVLVILSVCILVVSTAPVVPEQVGCAEGEPLVGQFIIHLLYCFNCEFPDNFHFLYNVSCLISTVNNYFLQ